MENLNFLHKEGFLTEDDLTVNLERFGKRVSFKTDVGLTIPIVVTSEYNNDVYLQHYNEDLNSFMIFWEKYVSKDIKGHPKFNFDNIIISGFNIIE